MGQYRMMTLAITSAAALALLAGCTITPAGEGSASSAEPNNVTVQAATADSPEKQLKDAVKDYAHQTYGDDVDIHVALYKGLVNIYVETQWTAGNPPPDTAAAERDATTVVSGVLDAVPGLTQPHASIQVRDPEKNNLITVVNDNGIKVKCNVFTGVGQDEIKAPEDNPDTITLDEFNQIRNGMEYQEVFDIIGGRGELLSDVDMGFGDEYYTATYSWVGEGSLGANANVMFQGGKVVSKAQFGLE